MCKKTKSFRLLAFVLSFVIAMTACPISALAMGLSAEIAEDNKPSEENKSTYIGEENQNPYLEEDVSLRDKFTKHYIAPDGSRYAVIFPEQVHYAENNSWVEIDNTLSYDITTKQYVSKNEKFKTKFSQASGNHQLVTIEDGDYRLSWSLSFATEIDPSTAKTTASGFADMPNQHIANVNAQILETTDDENTKIRNKDNISQFGKAMSGIKYSGVFNQTVDLRYSVLHGKVEEDIILNSPEGFVSYTMAIKTNGLIAMKQADNCIVFVTSEGETVFTLGAPWMKDSYLSVSDDIEVTVVQNGDIAYITYTPEDKWLKDEARVYPVLIDPSFTTRYYTSNYADTYVYQGDSASITRPTETTMKVGNISGKNYYAYLKILNIPELIGMDSVDNVTLDFWVNTTASCTQHI